MILLTINLIEEDNARLRLASLLEQKSQLPLSFTNPLPFDDSHNWIVANRSMDHLQWIEQALTSSPSVCTQTEPGNAESSVT